MHVGLQVGRDIIHFATINYPTIIGRTMLGDFIVRKTQRLFKTRIFHFWGNMLSELLVDPCTLIFTLGKTVRLSRLFDEHQLVSGFANLTD